MWLIILSDQLPIEALVSLYLTNKLMGRGLIFRQWLRREATFFRKARRLRSLIRY